MSPLLAFCIGVVLGYIVRGWFRKSSDNTYPYHTYTDSIIDVDEDFMADKPMYFGRPIKVESIEPMFEQVWLKENKYKDYLYSKKLSDDDYIAYHKWEEENQKEMREKHTPNVIVYGGKADHLVFHGGCLGCQSQQTYGVDRCKGCLYFKFNHNLPDLKIQ